MCEAASSRVTKLVVNWDHGDQDARDALIPLAYEELRRLARRHLWHEPPEHTLQNAAPFARLTFVWPSKKLHSGKTGHISRGVAAQLMRHILVIMRETVLRPSVVRGLRD